MRLLLPIHFNAISIHMHMLMNRLESIYLDVDYHVLVYLWVMHVGSMLSLLQLILSKEYN